MERPGKDPEEALETGGAAAAAKEAGPGLARGYAPPRKQWGG